METQKKLLSLSGSEKPKPSDVEVSEVFRQLTSTGRVSKVVPVRMGDNVIPIRFMVLTMKEIHSARMDTDAFFRSKNAKPSDDTYKERLICEILKRSCKEEKEHSTPDKKFFRPVFADADQVQQLTDDEVITLFEQYTVVKCDYAIPDESTIHTKEDLEAWIEAMSLEANASFLARLPLSQLARLGHMMSLEIQRLRSSPQSDWENISELRQLILGSKSTFATEPLADGGETKTDRIHLSARKGSSPRRQDSERIKNRRKTKDLLKKASQHGRKDRD